MRFHDYFRKQKLRDQNFRMAFPTNIANTFVLFSKYATSTEYRRVCRHIFELKTLNPEIDLQLLDFETEGRWLCQQSFSGTVRSRIAFELQADYAMFRMFGFGE